MGHVTGTLNYDRTHMSNHVSMGTYGPARGISSYLLLSESGSWFLMLWLQLICDMLKPYRIIHNVCKMRIVQIPRGGRTLELPFKSNFVIDKITFVETKLLLCYTWRDHSPSITFRILS